MPVILADPAHEREYLRPPPAKDTSHPEGLAQPRDW